MQYRFKMEIKKVKLSNTQIANLIQLKRVYGDRGRKDTLHNHQYIVSLIEDRVDKKEHFFKIREQCSRGKKSFVRIQDCITDECITEAEKIVYPPKKKLKEVVVVFVSVSELDFDDQFYDHEKEEPHEIEFTSDSYSAVPISIDRLKNYIKEAEKKKATYVYISYHEDHIGYDMDFVKYVKNA